MIDTFILSIFTVAGELGSIDSSTVSYNSVWVNCDIHFHIFGEECFYFLSHNFVPRGATDHDYLLNLVLIHLSVLQGPRHACKVRIGEFSDTIIELR